MKTWYHIRAAATDPSIADISIHDEIGMWGISAKNFIRDLKALGPVQQIRLSLHSPGGEVFDGIAIYNALKNHPATVTGIVEGIAASMASVIAMACDTLSMPANAFLMIHNPSGLVIGDAEDMKDMAALLDKLRGSLITAYTSKTGMSEDELIPMLDAETWLTGKEACDMGFCDICLDEVKAAASASAFDTRRFLKMPKALLTTPVASSEDEPTPCAPAPAVEPVVDSPIVADPPADPAPSAPTPVVEPVVDPPAEPTGLVAKFIAGVKALGGVDARVTALTAQLGERDGTIATLTARIAEMEPKATAHDQLEASLRQLEAQQQTTASAAAAIVAQAGFTPATESALPPPANDPGDILAQLEAITDPVDRQKFYAANKAAILAAATAARK